MLSLLRHSKSIATLCVSVVFFGWVPVANAQVYSFVKVADVSRACIETSNRLPSAKPLPANRILNACSTIDYRDEDILVYDLTADECRTLNDMSGASDFGISNAYVANSGSRALLSDLANSLFATNEHANFTFDASSGEINPGRPFVCAQGETVTGPPVLGQGGYFKASNPEDYDEFGSSVAISGDTLVVGAALEDSSGSNQADNSLENSGAVYVFVRVNGVWQQQAYLKASNPGEGDNFGSILDIDGDTIVVGVPEEDSNGTDPANNDFANSGAVYVFQRQAGVWTEQAYLKASNANTSDRFGFAVAISGDSLVIGAPGERSNATGVDGYQNDNSMISAGAAYVFERDQNSWSQQAYLKADATNEYDTFGASVATDSDNIIVGMTGDDDWKSGSGAAFVFIRENASWIQQAKLKASTPDTSDHFGWAVAIRGDRALIGAPHEDSNGSGVNDNSVTDAGAAYVFDRQLGVWSQSQYLKASSPARLDRFGRFLALSDSLLVLTAENESSVEYTSGAVYTFAVDNGVWTQSNLLKAAVPGVGDHLGRAVDVAGNVVVAGAFREDGGSSGVGGDQTDNSKPASGAAYLFTPTAAPPPDTVAPVVTAPTDISGVEATAQLTPVDIGTAIATDDQDQNPTVSSDSPGSFPLGETLVTWSATDSSGNTGYDVQAVEIVDTTAPVLTVPADITAPATGEFTQVNIGNASAIDNAGAVQSVVNDAPAGGFPVGINYVNWTATDASSNSTTGLQRVTITTAPAPVEINVPSAGYSIAPKIDGSLATGEWKNANRLTLDNGFLKFKHDQDRLYILIDMLADDGNDPFIQGGGDQFWLYFDVNEDGLITPEVDLRYRLESGTGNLRKQTFCDDCGPFGGFGFNPLNSNILSSRAEGFGCFFEDGTIHSTTLQCNNHRVWELAIDLSEIGMRVDGTVRFGYLVASGSPLQSESNPGNLNDMGSYNLLTLLGDTRQPTNTSPGNVNAQFEVTQAIQTSANSLDLVAGKAALVRIWADSNESTLKNFIYGSVNGIDLPGSPLLDVERLVAATYRQDEARDSITFNSSTSLPDSWTKTATVDFNIVNRSLNDAQVSTLQASLKFAPTREPVFWTFPVRNHIDGKGSSAPLDYQITNSEWALQRLAPIRHVKIVRRPEVDVQNVTKKSQMIEHLQTYEGQMILSWTLGLFFSGESPFDLPEQVTGFSPISLGTSGGSANTTWAGGGYAGVSSWIAPANNGLGDYGYAHEINHNLDKSSTGTWGRHSKGCTEEGLDPSWPYDDDFTIQEVGVERFDTQFSSVSRSTPDLMSYCVSSRPEVWISPYRWNAWLSLFGTDQQPVQAMSESRMVGWRSHIEASPDDLEASFYIQGRVYPDGSGEFGQILRQVGLPGPSVMTGDYVLKILNCSDQTLVEDRFDASFTDVEGDTLDYLSFSKIMPAPATACSLQLFLDDAVLDTRTITANTPTVELTSPNGGEHWDGIENIIWAASDADGDDLLFTLMYSADGGSVWHSIATQIDANEYQIDSAKLSGSDNATIMVMVTDGANTDLDFSNAAFSVSTKPAKIEILSPQNQGVFVPGQAILLNGLGRDSFGAQTAEDSLSWEVDGEVVAMGNLQDVYLESGSHDITLIVDVPGLPLSSETVTILVTDATGTISIEPGPYTVSEDDPVIRVRISRTGGAVGDASVIYWTQDDLAISGGDSNLGENDFDQIPEADEHTLEWAEGDATERIISVNINPDDVAEGAETFKFLIKAIGDESLGTSVVTITISANDNAGEVIYRDSFE